MVNGILSLILGSGIIGLLLFYRSRRRKSNAEADVSEFDAKVMQIKHFSQQLKEAYEEIDKMQDVIDRTRGQLFELGKSFSELRLEFLQEQERRFVAEFHECRRTNCKDRIPLRENHSKASGL